MGSLTSSSSLPYLSKPTESRPIVNGGRVNMSTRFRLTVLRSPVTEVIQPGHLPSLCLVQVRNDRTDNRTPQVPGVEWFGNVWRRKVNKQVLTLAILGSTVSGGFVIGVLASVAGHGVDFAEEVVHEALFAVLLARETSV